MGVRRHTEAAFESVIESGLVANGYEPISGGGYDRQRGIFPETVLAFIRETQAETWSKLEALLGEKTGEQILSDLCRWMDQYGSLSTLRHGFKCYGRTLHAAYFKAAHELNPDLEARYAANRLGLTRQLRFSPRSEKSVDVALSLNGIPVATLELKNPLSGQRVEDARDQYKRDRDPREPIFQFKRRTLVHFAVDTESVLMTTRLASEATRFLPFNRGRDGGSGNPPDPKGRTYRTAYLWEEVLQRDSLLDLLARFVHLQVDEKRDEHGGRVKVETMIFPRYHQLQAVRLLVAAARRGEGGAQLSGRTLGWQRQEQHDRLARASAGVTARRRKYARVRQRDRRHGSRGPRPAASEHHLPVRAPTGRRAAGSREARASSRKRSKGAVPVIVTTLQKFPFVSRRLITMAEERGTAGTGTLPTRRCAVIVDEAHSSQGGEAAADLKGVLGGEQLREEARKRAAEEGMPNMEELFRDMAKRGRQANLSFFAFTATPKHKTFAVFGQDSQPAHRYTMRQAIEEGFILDVLKHYTTYSAYFKLLKAVEDDPEVERKKAARALARFLRLHPHNLAQKTEVMVEHFHEVTRYRIGGHAKAMVVTGSRLEAVRYKQSFDRYISRKGYAIKSLVAFSGTVVDDKVPDTTYTERGMNQGISEKELPEKFATQDYRVLLVADKYQTGFDQPLLHTLFVGQAVGGNPGGTDAVATKPRASAQGRHLCSRLRERPGRDPGSIQDVLRGRRDGRGSRPSPDVRGQERTGCLGRLSG